MRFLLAAILALALWTPVAAEERLRVQRLDDSFIDAGLDRGGVTGSQAVALLLQGSGCESVFAPGGLHGLLKPNAQVAVLRIEKPGVVPSEAKVTTCSPEFLRRNTIDARVFDVLAVLTHLRAEAPWWNRRLYVIGASEGATIAAVAGALSAETAGVVLVNGSVGAPFREGWTEAMAAQARAQGGAAAEQAARAEAASTWDRARATPTSETAFGAQNTLRWWASMIDLRPVNLLLKLRAPILLYQAERDEMTPVASARAAAGAFTRAGKTNLTYREFPGANHAMGRREWNVVASDLATLIRQEEAKGSGQAASRGSTAAP